MGDATTSLTITGCFQRCFVRSASGRKRFNVLGALNAITLEIITVTNDSYINALSVCDLLKKLAANHAEETITLFLDNARYQKCKLVQELADQLKIELIYLPSYSSNSRSVFYPLKINVLCFRVSTRKVTKNVAKIQKLAKKAILLLVVIFSIY
jgi:hypothetical protein